MAPYRRRRRDPFRGAILAPRISPGPMSDREPMSDPPPAGESKGPAEPMEVPSRPSGPPDPSHADRKS